MARPEPGRRARPEDVVRGPAPGEFLVRDGDRVAQAYAIVSGDTTWVFHDGTVYEIGAPRPSRKAHRGGHAHSELTAPMPATVVAIKVAPGDSVKKGDILIVLEAMKMELPLRALGDGVVSAVHCREGELVPADATLVEFA